MNKSNAQARKERNKRERIEHEAQMTALRKIRDSKEATPQERLEAVKLLMEFENCGKIHSEH